MLMQRLMALICLPLAVAGMVLSASLLAGFRAFLNPEWFGLRISAAAFNTLLIAAGSLLVICYAVAWSMLRPDVPWCGHPRRVWKLAFVGSFLTGCGIVASLAVASLLIR